MTRPVPVDLSRTDGVGSVVGLLRPPIVVNPNNLGFLAPVPPLGIAYLAAAVRACGHEVQVVDAAGEALDRYIEFPTAAGPMGRIGLDPVDAVARLRDDTDVIGINLMFLHEWHQALELARAARRRFPRAMIVAGGETSTACRDELLAAAPEIDHLVLGEGEQTFTEMLHRRATGRSLSDIDGLVSRTTESGRDVAAPGLPVRLRGLEQLPRPAWDLIPLESYWAHNPHGVNRGRSMPMLATRGCPYKCTFCSSPQMWTTRYVVRDPDDLADEMAEYVERFGIANVNFHDLTAITKRQWTLDLCDALERRGVDVSWQLPVGTRSEALDGEVLGRLFAAGCRNLTYAPESGSPRLLAIMDKRVDLDHILLSVRAARQVGISPAMNFIIGHPHERWSDLWKTFRCAMRASWAGCDDLSPIIFAPYPGSKDWDDLAADGKVTLDDVAFYGGVNRAGRSSQSWNQRLSGRQLRAVQLGMLAAFYAVRLVRDPGRVRRIARARQTGEETTHLDELLRGRRDMRAQQHRLHTEVEGEPAASLAD